MINLCPDRKDYYRQTNNELDPSISCQCTSMVAGLDLVYRHDVSVIDELGDYGQPEDDLRYFTGHDVDVLAFCKKSHPGSALHPSEWADVLVYAVNKVYGKKLYILTVILPLNLSLPIWREACLSWHQCTIAR
jgi:hypothetical protein